MSDSPPSASITIKARHINHLIHTTVPYEDDTCQLAVVSGCTSVWLFGTPDELDEIIVRLGDAVVEGRRKIRERREQRLANIDLADRALGFQGAVA